MCFSEFPKYRYIKEHSVVSVVSRVGRRLIAAAGRANTGSATFQRTEAAEHRLISMVPAPRTAQ